MTTEAYYNAALFVATAAAYCYYNWQYFAFTSSLLERQRPPIWFLFLTFLVNYSAFSLMTTAAFPLALNWTVFMGLIMLETMTYYRCSLQRALFLSINGVFWGLALNISFRCLVAIILNQPLMAFSNQVIEFSYFRGYPILCGFCLGGVLLYLLRQPKYESKLRVICLDEGSNLWFFNAVMAIMYGYLYLNLLLYSTPYEGLTLKLWGIKSCVLVLLGNYLNIQYTYRMSRYSYYRMQNLRMEKALVAEQGEAEALYSIVYTDLLTGLQNQKAARETIARMLEEQRPFCLCFIDLNGLKQVNDQLGHSAGDEYLLAVAEVLRGICLENQELLFRYGGDEFILLFPGADIDFAARQAQLANQQLGRISGTAQYPFAMSLSYGLANSQEAATMEALLQAADAKMYVYKAQHRERAGRTDERR